MILIENPVMYEMVRHFLLIIYPLLIESDFVKSLYFCFQSFAFKSSITALQNKEWGNKSEYSNVRDR